MIKSDLRYRDITEAGQKYEVPFADLLLHITAGRLRHLAAGAELPDLLDPAHTQLLDLLDPAQTQHSRVTLCRSCTSFTAAKCQTCSAFPHVTSGRRNTQSLHNRPRTLRPNPQGPLWGPERGRGAPELSRQLIPPTNSPNNPDRGAAHLRVPRRRFSPPAAERWSDGASSAGWQV